MNSKKLLSILGVAGVVAHAASITVGPVQASTTPAQLESLLQQDPTGSEASAAFDLLAARFKDRDDKGRPDLFGPPGKPVIGPPGQYQG